LIANYGVKSQVLYQINSYMKQFKATVRASGVVVSTIVFADNSSNAMRILQTQFGVKNVLSTPKQLEQKKCV